MKRFLLISTLSLLLVGCSSKYLIGYHYLGEQGIVTGPVSQKTEKISKPFEEKCIQALMEADTDSFKDLFTDKLLKAVPKNVVTELKNGIQHRYQPNGRYDRLPIANRHTEHLHTELDTASLVNGLRHYDYIEVNYLLYGASNASVRLYLTEIGENARLSGFELYDADSSKNDTRFSIQYLAPETVDKGGLIGREILNFPK